MEGSIFRRYFAPHVELVDRFDSEAQNAVDVIIPVKNTNILWRTNLYNFYRQIPISRLLIGDGGCSDNTIEIARQFPRVEIVDQRSRKSLGYCIRELIELVDTEWFVYLHSDVYLPDGWFDTMVRYQRDFDWFECNRRRTVLVEYNDIWQNAAERPYSGSQMGRREVFDAFLDKIDDDHLYRNEDLVFQELVERSSGRYGRVSETYHYHQLMNRSGQAEPDFAQVQLVHDEDVERIKRTYDMQARGVIKYTQPTKDYLIETVKGALRTLHQYNALDPEEFCAWTVRTNPEWLAYVQDVVFPHRRRVIKGELVSIVRSLIRIARTLNAFRLRS